MYRNGSLASCQNGGRRFFVCLDRLIFAEAGRQGEQGEIKKLQKYPPGRLVIRRRAYYDKVHTAKQTAERIGTLSAVCRDTELYITGRTGRELAVCLWYILSVFLL